MAAIVALFAGYQWGHSEGTRDISRREAEAEPEKKHSSTPAHRSRREAGPVLRGTPMRHRGGSDENEPEETAEMLVEFAKSVGGYSGDPIANLDEMTREERIRAMKGILLMSFSSGGKFGKEYMLAREFFGISDTILEKMYADLSLFSVLRHEEESIRMEAIDRLNLSPELEELAMEIRRRAERFAARRNAQNITSVYSAAVAAGYSPDGGFEDAIDAITTSPGVTGTGEFKETYFYVPNVDRESRKNAARNLVWDESARAILYRRPED